MALVQLHNYPWLAESFDKLSLLYQQQRLAHALLLSGPEGMGKFELAQLLSALLLCKNPQAGQHCGQCKSCLLLAAGNHPDLLLLQPEGTSLGVDEIRRLTDFTQGRAQQHGHKVIIVRHAERMTEAAANALLKTLEEPPAGCFLLLCTAQAQRLKPTILSRCQRWALAPLVPQALADYLAAQHSGPIADFIISFSGGAPLKAMALLQSDQYAPLDTLLQQLFTVLLQRQPLQPMLKTLEGRTDLSLILSYLLHKFSSEQRLGAQQLQTMQQSLIRFCRDEQHILGQNKSLAISAILSEWQQLLAPARAQPGRR